MSSAHVMLPRYVLSTVKAASIPLPSSFQRPQTKKRVDPISTMFVGALERPAQGSVPERVPRHVELQKQGVAIRVILQEPWDVTVEHVIHDHGTGRLVEDLVRKEP